MIHGLFLLLVVRFTRQGRIVQASRRPIRFQNSLGGSLCLLHRGGERAAMRPPVRSGEKMLGAQIVLDHTLGKRP